MDPARSLKVPFGAVVLGMMSLASFMGHRAATAKKPVEDETGNV